jgi:hypothetical protein
MTIHASLQRRGAPMRRFATVALAAVALNVAFPASAQPPGSTVTFVNGGITQDEADALRARARDYPLEIQFAARTETGNAFVADVHVRITDAHGRQVMVLPSADPILLATLPPGRYTVEATFEGETKRQQVDVGRGHTKIGFAWQ